MLELLDSGVILESRLGDSDEAFDRQSPPADDYQNVGPDSLGFHEIRVSCHTPASI